MKRAGLLLLWILAALCLTSAATGQTGFALKDHDTVVFYGDSITDQRFYTTLTEAYVVTRYPKLDVRFVHSGWGGDMVSGGRGGPIDTRLPRDVLAYHPTVVTIMLGMNDGHYSPYSESTYTVYTTGMQHILASLKQNAPNARITLIQPSPYDDFTRPPKFEGGYNAVLIKYGEYLARVAREGHYGLADLNTPVVSMLKKANAANPVLALQIIPDRIHPGYTGHLIMAESLLKSWNATPLVSTVEIDAAAGKAVQASNATVTDIHTGAALSWTALEGSLPMPVDMHDPAPLVLENSDFTDALNQETLKINGLAARSYQLAIDGAPAGSFTADQLAKGINLATLSTPMSDQATLVYRLVVQHNNVHYFRWRQLQVPPDNVKLKVSQKTLDELDDVEAQLVSQLREKAQPKPHTFTLTPAP